MTNFKYILEPYRGIQSRHICPGCGFKHKFTRYIDSDTGMYLADFVGKCDRENSCGYHFTPKRFFNENPTGKNNSNNFRVTDPKQLIIQPIDYLPFSIFEKSVLKYYQCNFFPFLKKIFGVNIGKQLCQDYFIGANANGDTVFWQADINGKIRQAKVMRYNPSTGRRNKKFGAQFKGKAILKDINANLQQCFFGEFLLSLPQNKDKPIAIVESEKSAVIASIYFPQFIWLATGGKHGCKWTQKSVCSVLAERKVILFPDIGAYDCWKGKERLIANVSGSMVVTSDLLEKNANYMERDEGLDIADYLVKFSYTEFLQLKK